jgi:4-hydroxybenzoate polyprenyltransferase
MTVSKARGLMITLRPIVSMVTIPWVAGMAVFAGYTHGDFSDPLLTDPSFYPRFILIVLASFLGVTAGYAVNDYFDYRVDSANAERVDKAANHGIGRRDLLAYAAVLGLPSLLIMLYLSYLTFMVAVVQIAFIYLYSAWGKANTPGSNLLVVVPTALMPIAVFFVYTSELPLEAFLLFLANFAFEPGFTWAGVCRDVAADEELRVPSLPILYGIPATARIILVSWLSLAVLTIVIFLATDLGLVFLVGSMVAAIWLLAAAVGLIKNPTPEVGGVTFLKATLWFWVFSISMILDVAFHYTI